MHLRVSGKVISQSIFSSSSTLAAILLKLFRPMRLANSRARRSTSIVLSLVIVASLLLQPFSLGGAYNAGIAVANAQAAPETNLEAPSSTSEPLGASNIVGTPTPEMQPPPPGQPVEMVPTPQPQQPRPYLLGRSKVAPGEVAVGEIFTATITVENLSSEAANGLSVNLPLPAGVQMADGSSSSAYAWQQSSLGGSASVDVVVSLRLAQAQPGDAIVLRSQISATNLLGQGNEGSITSVGGALIVDRAQGPSASSFTPGAAASVRSADNRVEVSLPGNASDRALALRYGRDPKLTSKGTPEDKVPNTDAGRGRGFATFYLNATDSAGNEVRRFSAPVTIKISYTPQQLEALGISEADLTLFWFDENVPNEDGTTGHWVAVDTDVDTRAHTASAKVDHFTAFTLSDSSSPSEAYIPSLQGWQASLFTGSVSYHYPIEVPAGPGGIRPSLTLNYSSAATDGTNGQREKQQSGWAGKGWSLDTGYIALHRFSGQRNASRYYSLVFNGQSYDIARGAALVTAPSASDPTDWEWRSTDESFLRVRVEQNGVSYGSATSPGKGGFNQNGAMPRYKWKVWTKDGTRFDFETDAWQGFETRDANKLCVSNGTFMETYKWYLTRVEDTHGNRINYSYARSDAATGYKGFGWRDALCLGVAGTVEWSVWPTHITWGENIVAGSPDRYWVEFVSSGRAIDTQADYAENQLGPGPQETRRLDYIKIYSLQASTWELVRQYNLGYEAVSANYLTSDQSVDNLNGTYSENNGYPKITLTNIRQVGKDGTSALPATTFAYNVNRGSGYCPDGGWNRLQSANNGQGGTITFAYENLCAVHGNSLFRNFTRVKTKTATDGRGNSYVWSYSYANPALNTLGTVKDSSHGPNQYPNSATVFFNYYYPAPYGVVGLRKVKTEFRGHGYVVEKDPNGNETEHWFYQGDVGCNPSTTLTGDNIYNDACFQQLRNREFLKGREYQAITRQGLRTGPKLSEVDHSFTVNFLSDGRDAYGDDRFQGLWRAFAYERQTVETAWDSGTTPLTRTTDYTYETTYGNITSVQESLGATVLRVTDHSYLTRNDATSYIVDRKRNDNVFNGAGQWLARTVYGYDGSYGAGTLGTRGLLTLERGYYNLAVPPSTALPATLYSSDTSYGYDSYGNQTTVTTYAGAGSAAGDGSSWSLPGGGIGAATTTTTYDGIFHAYPVRVTTPANDAAVQLSEGASYDYRMGTMTSVTDYNGQVSNATYDVFGRLDTMWRPGDSSTYPTVDVLYTNYNSTTGAPTRNIVYEREVAGSSSTRQTTTFYDGMSRVIQTKSESTASTQNIVADTVYDGVGQAIKQSQPRYVAETSTTFSTYTPHAADATMNWTLTSYDGLGRATSIQAPDTSTTTNVYTIYNGRRAVTTYDPNGHASRRESDLAGRLLRVAEYSGEASPYTLYSTTDYEYSPRDLLTKVTDGNLKVTTVAFDSLGRKTSMTDPTMGTWSYEYNPDGTLKKQTDARGQWIAFTYDKLDRLTYRNYSDGSATRYIYDEGRTGYFNKGQRTSMMRYTTAGAVQSATYFDYDERGRQERVQHSIPALGSAYRVFQWAYDSADRTTSVTYPSGEAVSYTYDAAWRQTSACGTSQAACYARNATYTALDQPQSFTYGNGLSQNYSYESVTKRLQSLQVGTSGSVLSRSYTYDAVGNIKTLTDSDGTHSFNYDHLDRLTFWGWPGADENYAYDKLGNLTTKGTNAAPITYNYNSAATTNGGPYAVRSLNGGTAFQYDANGNTTSSPATPFGDPARTLSWNVESLPLSITSGTVTESYTYDADGERASRAVTQGGATTTTYYFGGLYEEEKPSGKTRSLYSLGGRVVAQNEYDPTPPNNATFVSQNVPTSLITSQQFQVSITMQNSGTNTWSETTAYRLGSQNPQDNLTWGTRRLYLPAGVSVAPGQSYTWTVGMNAPSTAGTYNFQWRMVRDGTGWFGDSTTNVQISVRAPCTGPGCSVDIDPCENPDNCPASFADPGALQRATDEDGAGGDHQDEDDSAGTQTSAQASTGGASYSIQSSGTNTVVYLHTDHLGSVSAVTNGSGAVLSRQQYDPWGKVRSGGISQTELSYTGQRKDDTGLHYYHARYYDSGVGRFNSADTIVPGGLSDPQSMARYSYVQNNPVRRVDPTGHKSEEAGEGDFYWGCDWECFRSRLLAAVRYEPEGGTDESLKQNDGNGKWPPDPPPPSRYYLDCRLGFREISNQILKQGSRLYRDVDFEVAIRCNWIADQLEVHWHATVAGNSGTVTFPGARSMCPGDLGGWLFGCDLQMVAGRVVIPQGSEALIWYGFTAIAQLGKGGAYVYGSGTLVKGYPGP